jgi:hypothetical protein
LFVDTLTILPHFGHVVNSDHHMAVRHCQIPRGVLVAKTTPHTPSPCKAAPASDLEKDIAALWEPEEVSQKTITSLQAASGIWDSDLEMTINGLVPWLNLVLDQAWQKVRGSLAMPDLWTVAQAAYDLEAGHRHTLEHRVFPGSVREGVG